MIDELTLWRNFIRTIVIAPLPFRLEVRPRGDYPPVLVVKLNVADVRDGHPTQAGTSEQLPPFNGPPGVLVHPDVAARNAESFVYNVVSRVWLHELREHWTVGGRNTRDPHAGFGDGVGGDK